MKTLHDYYEALRAMQEQYDKLEAMGITPGRTLENMMNEVRNKIDELKERKEEDI